MKPLKHYVMQRINLSEKVGNPATADFHRLILQHSGFGEFVEWCDQDFTGIESESDAFRIDGFESRQDRIAFFNDNHGVIKAMIIEQAKKEGVSVGRSALSKSMHVYIKSFPWWETLFPEITDETLEIIFLMNDRTTEDYSWFVNTFIGYHLLETGYELKTKVLKPYLQLTKEDEAQR